MNITTVPATEELPIGLRILESFANGAIFLAMIPVMAVSFSVGVSAYLIRQAFLGGYESSKKFNKDAA